MKIPEINQLLDRVNQVASRATGNYYLLLIDSIEEVEQWLLLWGREKEGYYEIAGNAVFIMQSSLNTIIDITDKFTDL